MSPRTTRGLVYLALLLFYLAHNDLWLWDDARIVLGLPIGLTFHVAYCIVAALLMAVLVRVAWDGRLATEHRPEDRS